MISTSRSGSPTSPPTSSPLKGLADLDELVGRLARAGMQVDYEIEGPPRPLPKLVDGSAYRIIQESLTNIAKHAADARGPRARALRADHAVARGVRRRTVRPSTARTGERQRQERRRAARSGCANVSPSSAGTSKPARSPAAATPSPPNSRWSRSEMTATPIRVLIVDDDVATRVGLRAIMAAEPDIEVVGESGSAEDAYGQIPRRRARRRADGRAAPRRRRHHGDRADHVSRRRSTGPRVIVLTTFEIDDYVFRSLRAGASGFLLKRARAEDLTDAVRIGRERQRAPRARCSPGRLIERFAVLSPERRPAVQTLTDREREVLVLIAGGRSNQEIARRPLDLARHREVTREARLHEARRPRPLAGRDRRLRERARRAARVSTPLTTAYRASPRGGTPGTPDVRHEQGDDAHEVELAEQRFEDRAHAARDPGEPSGRRSRRSSA